MSANLYKLTRLEQLICLFASALLCVLCACSMTWARQQPKYQFDSWTTENGLPQNSINDILQTRDGYLWLATNGGLVRFDGVRFVVFDRSIEGIKSQRVTALLEDSKGRLWVGTEDGMLIRYSDRKFMTYTVKDGLPYASAAKIEEDDDGNLWVTWYGAEIVVTKFDGTRFVNYLPEDFAHNLSVDLDSRRYPWWSQDSDGLHYLVKGRVQTYLFQNKLSDTQVAAVRQDQYGNLWIQTQSSTVIKATDKGSKLYTAREGLPHNLLGSILEDRKGDLWLRRLGIEGNLYRIKDGKRELIDRFQAVTKFYEDREGSVWIGTLAGLHRMRELSITLLTEREGLSLNRVYSIFQDRRDAIWIGTWTGGLNRYEQGRFSHYGTAQGLPSDRITCTYEDSSGRLWVGTIAGVGYFKNGHFIKYADKYGFLKQQVWAIHEDRVGDFWFATDKGLVRLKNGDFTRFTSKEGLSDDWLKMFFEDRAGTLWIGTTNGLTRLKDGVFTTYTEDKGFIGSDVRAIYEDGEGVLWIGTYDGGLYRFEDERLTRYTTKEGLHDNGVFGILEDEDGNLWMSSNRGIYRVSRRELNDFAEGRIGSITSVFFGTKDGLTTLECNGGRQPSALKTKDGRLWFPTMGGVAIIDPKAVPSNPQPPPVIIEEFRIDNKAIDFRDGAKVSPDKDSFEIRYTAPSFIKPEYVKFKYRLEGFDNDWTEAGTHRFVNYRYVPPGEYTFTVIASNSDGIWNQSGSSVKINVIPYWWEIRWVQGLLILIVLLFLVSSVAFWYKHRVSQLEKEKEVQEDFSKQLIGSQENERGRVARELHDGLSQVFVRIKIGAQLARTELDKPAGLDKRLNKIASEASDGIDETKEIVDQLHLYQIKQLGLTKSMEVMIKKSSDSDLNKIKFKTRIDSIDGLFEKDFENHIFRIVQESVSNITKHSEATEAEVIINKNLPNVKITVRDNGKGFIRKPSKFDKQSKRSFGLMSLEERTRLLGGKITIQSREGKGTAITIKLKLEDENK